MKRGLFLELLIETDSGKDNCSFQSLLSSIHSHSHTVSTVCQYYYTNALHVLICSYLVHNYTCGFAERNFNLIVLPVTQHEKRQI